MDFIAIFCAVAIKGIILWWWEARKIRLATPGKQIVTIAAKKVYYAPRI